VWGPRSIKSVGPNPIDPDKKIKKRKNCVIFSICLLFICDVRVSLQSSYTYFYSLQKKYILLFHTHSVSLFEGSGDFHQWTRVYPGICYRGSSKGLGDISPQQSAGAKPRWGLGRSHQKLETNAHVDFKNTRI